MAPALCVSFLAFAFWSSAALAAFQHPFLSQLTGAPGNSRGLCGVTVDPASQNVYVANPEIQDSAIDVFSSLGVYQSLITGMGTPNSSFSSSACTTAVSDVSGDVYVADSGPSVVFVFGVLGNYVSVMSGSATPGGSFGEGAGEVHVAVVQSSGDVYVSDSSHGVVDRFSSAGVYLSQLTGFSSPSGVASDAGGDVYVVDRGLGVVDEFNSAGTRVGQITGSGAPGGSFGGLAGVAVDAAGHVYVADSGRRVVDEFDALGVFVGDVTGAPGASFSEPEGVAVNAAGDLYVADHGSPGVVDVFGPSTPGPFIAGEPASNVTSTSVTLRALVNPNGKDTTYYFQYGTSSSYGVSVPAQPGADIGSGSGYQAVSQTLGGLAPSTSYHYRVVAVNNALETSYGPDQLIGTNTTPATPPSYSSSPGLPDGRVYEQVSPTNKNGNGAGAGSGASGQPEDQYSVASADGNAMLFWASGAVGNASSGLADYFVARRSAAGWSTTAATPRPTSGEINVFSSPTVMLSSADLSHVAFEEQSGKDGGFGFPGIGSGGQLYLAGLDPLAQPTWLSRPTIPAPIQEGIAPWLAGASPDLSTVYFGYDGTLLPQDASRTPYAGKSTGEGGSSSGSSYLNPSAAGFYEWSSGVLLPAGVLPDGSIDPFGAVPAAEALAYNKNPASVTAEELNNQVSTDGSHAFFVSPDPSFCVQNSPVCGGDQPELYARVTAADGSQSTVLVSKSAITGQPAPHGPLQIQNAHGLTGGDQALGDARPYVYASPDGSRAFFESMDQLTSDAPNGSSVKAYDFNLTTGSLAYLPGVADLPPESASAEVGGPLGTSSILVSSEDGSDFIFVRYPPGGVPQLELWRSGSSGGTVTPISQLPPSPAHQRAYSEKREPQPGGMAFVAARATADGSVFMFETDSSLPGFNNAPGYEEIYRYDAGANALSCVSCPPAGTTPSGDAQLAHSDLIRPIGGQLYGWLNVARGMSADGSRIFFDTPDPLVPQDTNTRPIEEEDSGSITRTYGRDVYEWESGKIYLLSSGTGVKNALVLDSSASGNDVFFATADGLVAGDTDGAYDVYDARVPRPGDVPLSSAVPCQGDVCQGPPRVPSLLGASPSETFSGPGNPAPLPAAKAVTHKQVKKKPKKAKKRKQKRKKASTRSKRRRK
jgi:hypothetical protein